MIRIMVIKFKSYIKVEAGHILKWGLPNYAMLTSTNEITIYSKSILENYY